MRTNKLNVLILGSMAFLFVACAGREHIREDHGKSSAEWYAKQRVHAKGSTDQQSGLDSEEAALIHQQYRSTIGGGAAPQAKSQVLIVDEGQSRGRRK
jgi:hypothetical protein